MTSSFSILECLVSVPIFVMVAMRLLPIHNVLSLNLTNAYLHHECLKSEGTYKPGSLYEKNINEIFSELTKKGSLIYGYGDASISGGGSNPHLAFLKVQCRSDISVSQCRSCVISAFSAVRKRCPENKGRLIWYDYCTIELTSADREKLNYKNYFYLHNAKDVSGNKESFNMKTKALLNNLKEKATKEKNRLAKNYMYATGEESIGTTKLYAMMQCTKDLHRKNCSVCLNGIMAEFSKCCNGKQGGRVLCGNCSFRYELYPFVKPLVNESSI